MFLISRDPPEGGSVVDGGNSMYITEFPISRDPPEGGTPLRLVRRKQPSAFPISRDPPEGGTGNQDPSSAGRAGQGFQFLGIPPKGEQPGLTPAGSSGLV